MDNYPPGITAYDIDKRFGEDTCLEEPFDADDDGGDYDPDLGDDSRNLPNVDPEELQELTKED